MAPSDPSSTSRPGQRQKHLALTLELSPKVGTGKEDNLLTLLSLPAKNLETFPSGGKVGVSSPLDRWKHQSLKEFDPPPPGQTSSCLVLSSRMETSTE